MSGEQRWLTAPAADVEAEIGRLRRAERSVWTPTWRRVLVDVNNALLLWFVAFACFAMGVQIDTVQDNRIYPADVVTIIVLTLIFVAWLGLSVLLSRWARRPPGRRTRLAQWRVELTARAHGFLPDDGPARRLDALITADRDTVLVRPRFARPGADLGVVAVSGGPDGRAKTWWYLAVVMGGDVPHVVLAATEPGAGAVPGGVIRGQHLSLEGDFDRTFRVYAPAGYERDALYVLAPDVMGVLVDDAADTNIEFVGGRAVFFAEDGADMTEATGWHRLARLSETLIPKLRLALDAYGDDRPDLDVPGGRLAQHDRTRGLIMLGQVLLRIVSLFVLYVVPASFAFAGVMSIVDGR